LPNIGPIGTAEAVTKVAQRAEALGYSSLWTIERLLYPVKLQRPYPGTPDGALPEIYRQVLDPLDSLTYVAAQTKKIKLGTSVLDMPYHNPVVLGRRLTTLDVLSNGRLNVGLGLGWNKDEMDATNADFTKRGALADELLPLLKAIWTTNPVEFHGSFFNVPKSYIDLKPVQKPHLPTYLVGQVEPVGGARGRVSGPTAREEDAGLGPAPQDLLHRLARGLGGLHRHLDRAEQLVHQTIRGQPIRRVLLRHALYDSTLTRRGFPCPPRPATASGASSAATSASAWASSSCARTSGACPPASRSATPSCRSASPSGWSRSWTASA